MECKNFRRPSTDDNVPRVAAAMLERMAALQSRGAHQYIPRQDRDYAFGVGLRMLVLPRMVIEDGGLFRMAPDAAEIVAYYANAIAHMSVPAETAEDG